MPEFKIKGLYLSSRVKPRGHSQEYHSFMINKGEVPKQYCDNETINCSLLIAEELVKDIESNLQFGKDYQFVINLGEDKTADFKQGKQSVLDNNKMYLKTPDHFTNTIKKIGLWDSSDYFYEARQKEDESPQKSNNSPTKSENKNNWEKLLLICLPFIILAFFLLLIISKWVSRKKINF